MKRTILKLKYISFIIFSLSTSSTILADTIPMGSLSIHSRAQQRIVQTVSASMGFGFGSNLSSIVLGCSFSVTYAYNDFSFTAGLSVSDNVVEGGARAKYKGYGGGII